jgi:hypothetical protein
MSCGGAGRDRCRCPRSMRSAPVGGLVRSCGISSARPVRRSRFGLFDPLGVADYDRTAGVVTRRPTAVRRSPANVRHARAPSFRRPIRPVAPPATIDPRGGARAAQSARPGPRLGSEMGSEGGLPANQPTAPPTPEKQKALPEQGFPKSGRPDLNRGPHRPERCADPRLPAYKSLQIARIMSRSSVSSRALVLARASRQTVCRKHLTVSGRRSTPPRFSVRRGQLGRPSRRVAHGRARRAS